MEGLERCAAGLAWEDQVREQDDSSNKPTTPLAEKGAERIYVSVRVRPLSDKEISRKDVSDWECINEATVIFKATIPERSLFPTAYSYDRVFGPDTSTDEVYDEGVQDVALSTLRGLNATIFAYGQTSSGKTYTMNGITDRAVDDVFKYIAKHPERTFVLKFSAVEIYNEVVRDLLSDDTAPLRILDDPERGMVVEKLVEEKVEDRDHFQKLLTICKEHRQIGETSMNIESSRSHQIVKLTIESSPRDSGSKESSSSLVASLNLVDLAGSERASQALSSGQRLKEGSHINRSLFTLGIVIRKLSDPKTKSGHIPYRNSKLTRLLQHALGGNARTAMICTMSPARSHAEQSKNTLFFASCAKEVATSARVNVVMSDKALVKHLQKEVERLQIVLRTPQHSSSSEHFDSLLREKDLKIQKMEQEIRKLTEQRDAAQARLEELLQSIGTSEELKGWRPLSHNETDKSIQALPSFRGEGRLSDVSTSSGTSSQGAEYRHTVRYHLYNDEKGNRVSFDKISHQSTAEGQERNHMDLEDTEASSHSTPIKHPITETMSKPLLLVREIRKLEHAEKQLTQDASKALAALQRELHARTGPTSNNVESPAPPNETRDSLSLRLSRHESVSLGDLSLGSLDEEKLRLEMARLKPTGNAEEILSVLEHHLQNVHMPNKSGELVLSNNRRHSDAYVTRTSTLSEDAPTISPPSPSSFTSDGFDHRRDSSSGSKKRLIYRSDAETTVHGVSASAEENISNIRSYVSELKERVAKLRYQKQLLACQLTDMETDEATSDGKSMSMGNESVNQKAIFASPSQWPLEFDMHRMEIFELWDACHVSMVHRTHFFLLFKGDPSDGIYLEVELRRLLFLKKRFTQKGVVRAGPAQDDAHAPTLASSIRALRRERDILAKQMQKKLSAAEREDLFKKWGIPLGTKQRKWQLAYKIWTDTKDTTHIQDSADIVARVVGFWEPGQTSKEMFELSFTPLKHNQRLLSSGWNIVSSLFS